ncbi:hypothetical protein AB0L26_24535 [Streptomyces nondiastaticus]
MPLTELTGRTELFGERRRRALLLASGAALDFPPVTSAVRTDHVRRVAPPAPGPTDRRVEITGPPGKRMVVGALNSGAQVWTADFEDAPCGRPLSASLVDFGLYFPHQPDRTRDDVDAKAAGLLAARRVSGPPAEEGVRANIADAETAALAAEQPRARAAEAREIFERTALARELPAFFTADAYARYLGGRTEVRS